MPNNFNYRFPGVYDVNRLNSTPLALEIAVQPPSQLTTSLHTQNLPATISDPSVAVYESM